MPLGFRPQLNGLRALAILCVLFTHFWIDDIFGGPGVLWFFVLSGFLITSILLGQRQTDMTLGRKLRTFFARRMIRIWPLYYLVVLSASFADLEGIRASAPWHLSHLSDVYYLMRGDWDPWVAAHLWSLSLQEKFYLLWPFAVLLMPFRGLIALLGVIILAMTGVSLAGMALDRDTAEMVTAIAAPIGALATGAALAVAPYAGVDFQRLRVILAPAALLSMSAIVPILLLQHPALFLALQCSLYCVFFAYLTTGATIGFGGLTGRVLESPVLGYLGRISYGIYLLHMFVAAVMFTMAENMGYQIPPKGPATYLIMSSATIAVAMLSWHFYEKPINSLKRLYPYRVKPEARLAPAATTGKTLSRANH